MEIQKIFDYVANSLRVKLNEKTGWTSRTCKEMGLKQKNLSVYANKGIGQKVTFKNMFTIITALVGKPPLIIKDNELLPNMNHCAKSGREEILLRWIEQMEPDDMEVLFQLAELIKFRSTFTKNEWGLLVGAVTVLRKILILQVPAEDLLLTAGSQLPPPPPGSMN